MIFVNSMSDLLHAEIPDRMIAGVFAVMALSTSHTFQVLTKRPGRMRSLLTSPDFRWQVWHQMLTLAHDRSMPMPAEHGTALAWPLPNVWLGVSVETQKWADVRIPILLATPAPVRFLSMEPLLAPVTLAAWTLLTPPLHWVIVGGESGPGARRMDPQWAAALAEECQDAGVAFFMKQTGTVLAKEWDSSAREKTPRLAAHAAAGIPHELATGRAQQTWPPAPGCHSRAAAGTFPGMTSIVSGGTESCRHHPAAFVVAVAADR